MVTQRAKGPEPLAVPDEDSLTTTLWQKAESSPDREILRYPQGDSWRGVTWSQLADRVRKVAAGLIAAGVETGDRVAVMASTRIEWTITDLAILAAGAVTVPIYETSSADQCEWNLSDSGAKLAIVESADFAKRVDEAREGATGLGEIFVIDDGGLDDLAERADESHVSAVDERVKSVGTDDLASIIYTSGTTGKPKGCVITHGNLVTTARQTQMHLNEVFGDDESTLLFLPLAHSFARIIQFGCLESDVQMGYARSVDTLTEDLQSFKPTFLLSVPRVFEKMFNTAQRQAKGVAGRIFDWAVTVSRKWASADNPDPYTKLERAVADRLVYSKIRAALGGQVKYCVSGGAPLSPHLLYFFHAAGITILEGYGLTETSAASVVNTPQSYKLGSVGKPAPGVETAVAEDGELLLYGPGIFRGYWNNQQATDEDLHDGWFDTGDLGEIDDDGFVKITGRKKELIVTAGGKNVSPAVLEERLKENRLVSQAMVVGDNRPFIGALITLDPEQLADFAEEHNLSGSDPKQLRDTEAVQSELAKAVEHANAAVSKAESIRKIVVLERDFTQEDNELTPSMKIRRRDVAANFHDEIEGMYQK
jgi:long-chain acyl-CoA synthetase